MTRQPGGSTARPTARRREPRRDLRAPAPVTDAATATLATPRTPFRVLFVCTANHCRSPLADLLLADAVRRAGLGWSVGSCGTLARDGVAVHPSVARLLDEVGIDATGFRSQRMDADLVDRADLVLVAAAEHRSAVLGLRPSALPRTFTLLELAHLVDTDGGVGTAADGVSGPDELAEGRRRGTELLRRAAAERGRRQPLSPEAADLADPMGGPLSGFRTCWTAVTDALDAVLRGAGRPEVQVRR